VLSLGSSLWLLALATLPLVWWLQRFHELDRAHLVAALFLWPDRDAAGEQRQLSRRTDPLWWLRALTVALVVLALCEPRWSESNAGPLVIWVDDSASMFAQEKGISRTHQALAALEAQLAGNNYTSITLQSLAAPGEQLALDPRASAGLAAQLRQWTAGPRGEPKLPAAVSMDATATHWLVSDGASPGLTQWVQQAPIARVLEVGESIENVAVTALSLRPGSGQEGSVELLVTMANGGDEIAGRELEIYAAGEKLSSIPMTIAPGGSMRRLVPLPGDVAAPVTARINRADALALDDSLTLSDAVLRRLPVTVSAACGSHLRAALKAHHRLAPIGDETQAAGLQVYCGVPDTGRPGPALYASGEEGSAPIQGPLLWHRLAGPLRELLLEPAWLSAAPLSTASDEAVELLANPEGALLHFDLNRRVIVSRLDLAAPGLVNRPEYPLLIAGLVDLLLGVDGASDALSTAVAPNPARIAPRLLPLKSAFVGARNDSQARDLTGTLISAAILSLLLDLALAYRRRRAPSVPAKVAGAR
jgi:hypothetical protein